MRYEVDKDHCHQFETTGKLELEGLAPRYFAQIVGSLLKISPVRFGFAWKIGEQNPLPKKEISLKLHSSVTPLLCVAIALEEEKVLFLSPDLLYPYFEVKNTTIYGYTSLKASFRHNPLDPFGGQLKEMGYVSGDRLTNKTHPILFSE